MQFTQALNAACYNLNVFGTILQNMEHCRKAIQSKSKNSRYQAQDRGPYNPFILCRMFADLASANYGCLFLRHLL